MQIHFAIRWTATSTRFSPKRNNETHFCFLPTFYACVVNQCIYIYIFMYHICIQLVLPITKAMLICVSMECAVWTCLNRAITWNRDHRRQPKTTNTYTENVKCTKEKKPVWFLQHTQPAKNSGIEMVFSIFRCCFDNLYIYFGYIVTAALNRQNSVFMRSWFSHELQSSCCCVCIFFRSVFTFHWLKTISGIFPHFFKENFRSDFAIASIKFAIERDRLRYTHWKFTFTLVNRVRIFFFFQFTTLIVFFSSLGYFETCFICSVFFVFAHRVFLDLQQVE